jgi:dimethylargininase
MIELPADPTLPDGVFVEDMAIVLDEIAVMTSPTPVSRRPEIDGIIPVLRHYRSIARLPAGVRLEGGDLLRMGKVLYVGLSQRTDEAGLRALHEVVGPLGYTVLPVPVHGCLHLKSACTALDHDTLLVNRSWIDVDGLGGFRTVDVPSEEPWGANVLRLPDRLLVSAAYPRTADAIARLGYRIYTLDVSELHKAEGGLTCMSLLFKRTVPVA